MQKLTTLIGPCSRGRTNYVIAYAYHVHKALNRNVFTLTLSKTGVQSAGVDPEDRADILIDIESKTGMMTFSPTGDFFLSGKGNARHVKIASATAAEFLPTAFIDTGRMQPLTVTSISKKSISFKLPC